MPPADRRPPPPRSLTTASSKTYATSWPKTWQPGLLAPANPTALSTTSYAESAVDPLSPRHRQNSSRPAWTSYRTGLWGVSRNSSAWGRWLWCQQAPLASVPNSSTTQASAAALRRRHDLPQTASCEPSPSGPVPAPQPTGLWRIEKPSKTSSVSKEKLRDGNRADHLQHQTGRRTYGTQRAHPAVLRICRNLPCHRLR